MRFTVAPSVVAYSTDDSISVVDLTATIVNDRPEPLSCGPVVFTIPTGESDTALTSDPSTITTAPGESTPWAVSSDSSGRVHALALPPVTQIAAGASVSFVFGSVAVNRSAGVSAIEVVAELDGVQVTGTAHVTKDHPAEPGEGMPVIERFGVDPEQVARGGVTVVSWRVTGAATAVLEPGPVPLVPPDQGDLRVTVWDTTIFRLLAPGVAGTARASTVATVMPVVIEAFGADPAGPIGAGVEVTLGWRTRYANSCSIDQGVGPVATYGSVTVTPRQTTVYTLNASGREPRSSAVTIEVV